MIPPGKEQKAEKSQEGQRSVYKLYVTYWIIGKMSGAGSPFLNLTKCSAST